MPRNNDPAESLARLVDEVRSSTAPQVAAVSGLARRAIAHLATSDGWSEAQADWLGDHAVVTFVQSVADGMDPEEALTGAYGQARRLLLSSKFEEIVARGQSRATAFLALVELERHLCERSNDPVPERPEFALMAGCRAVEAAAREGASTIDQIETGFAMATEAATRRPL